ncbi:MAG: glycosyltransferase family 2 protein, partial [Prevotella sp.]|nr:glycosyltransferase family 2 protein [Prevotella sp.]
MDKVAIVILNWNGVDMMSRFLPTVMACSREDAVVYVADNASTDNSVEFLKTQYPDISLIILDKNYGFADGYNRALRQIEAEYYVLLNSDVEVTGGWVRMMTDFMDNHPEVAACQPKLLSEANKKAFEYAGACGGFIDRYGYPFCRGRILDTVENDEGQYDNAAEIHWSTGACMMIRSEDYWRAGGFDARFFAHCEEIDLCWRLRIMGRKIYCVPSSRVFHVGGGTLPKGSPMKTFLNFRNNLTMLYKNLPDVELKRVMRMRLFLDYVAAFQTLVKGNTGDYKAIIKGRREFR